MAEIVPVTPPGAPAAGDPPADALEAAYAILDAAEQAPSGEATEGGSAPADASASPEGQEQPAASAEGAEGAEGAQPETAQDRETARLLRQARKEQAERRAKLARREREKQEREELEKQKREWDGLRDRVSKRGLIAVAEEMGWTRDRLAKVLLDDSDPGLPAPPDPLDEVKKLRKDLDDERQARKREAEEAQAAALAEQEQYELDQIKQTVAGDPDRFDLLSRFPEYLGKVYEGMVMHFEETGEEVPYELAAERVERWLEKKFEGSKKLARRSPAAAPAPARGSPRSLSSARQPTAPPPKQEETLDDMMDRAMAIIQAGGHDRPY